VWSQQGAKLVGTGSAGVARQGSTVAVSADGNAAVIGGRSDDGDKGAAWVFKRSDGVWTQRGRRWLYRLTSGPYQGTKTLLVLK